MDPRGLQLHASLAHSNCANRRLRLCAKGAIQPEPRATPQEQRVPRYRGLKARATRRAVRSGFQPLGILALVPQGVALGWNEGGALPLGDATIAALDAESAEELENLESLL